MASEFASTAAPGRFAAACFASVRASFAAGLPAQVAGIATLSRSRSAGAAPSRTIVDAAWARAHLLEGGRLWNDTRWKNFGQEAELSKRTRTKVEYAPDAYVFHFRGGTLGAKACQNGHKDCATWQKNHRPDVGVYVRGMF